MVMRKLTSVGLLSCTALMAAGCQGPERVVERLPPPYHEPVTATPARPVKPTPAPPSSAQSIRGKTILVDPGHGGTDPGAPGHWGGVNEKTIVLAVAREVVQGLNQRGAKVVTTRNSDVLIDLDDRAELADRTRADLLVAIHADAAESESMSGATFYIAEGASQESVRAALRLESAFTRAGIVTRGIRRAKYRVLVKHSRPAVLIECGFLTNRFDSQQLNSAAYRSKLAAAIVAGIAEHFGR